MTKTGRGPLPLFTIEYLPAYKADGSADPWACHAVAHEMSIFRRLLAVYVSLLANKRVF